MRGVATAGGQKFLCGIDEGVAKLRAIIGRENIDKRGQDLVSF